MPNITIEKFVQKRNKEKKIFTAGPASLLKENIIGLRSCFGRGDDDYLLIENEVLKKLKKMSDHKNIVRFQGSGSLAIEIMMTNFLFGNIMIVNTGYYSDRLIQIAKSIKKSQKKIKNIIYLDWKKINTFDKKVDWILACPTETSCGLKIDIRDLNKLSKKSKAKLMLDATASFGLEDHHHLADVISYSSCKGLFGLTGASFINYNINPTNEIDSFYLNLENHINKKMTGPYHIIASLYYVLKTHNFFRESVKINKEIFIKKLKHNLTLPAKNQPLLCTHVDVNLRSKLKNVILYYPRNNLAGSVVCHLGEVHLGKKSRGKIIDLLQKY